MFGGYRYGTVGKPQPDMARRTIRIDMKRYACFNLFFIIIPALLIHQIKKAGSKHRMIAAPNLLLIITFNGSLKLLVVSLGFQINDSVLGQLRPVGIGGIGEYLVVIIEGGFPVGFRLAESAE
jgi:hypothetical protein